MLPALLERPSDRGRWILKKRRRLLLFISGLTKDVEPAFSGLASDSCPSDSSELKVVAGSIPATPAPEEPINRRYDPRTTADPPSPDPARSPCDWRVAAPAKNHRSHSAAPRQRLQLHQRPARRLQAPHIPASQPTPLAADKATNLASYAVPSRTPTPRCTSWHHGVGTAPPSLERTAASA